MRHLIWLIVLAAGCTDEVTIASGVCGNYVLDPGEDCDRPGGACTSECRIACDVTQRATACASADAIDGTCCPTSMICGTDSVCHAPTGTVQSTELVLPFDVNSLTFADIDGDLIADAVGIGSTSVDVRYGSSTAPLGTTSSTPVPPNGAGQVGYGDFDGDGRMDIAIPTQAGLFALSTQTGTPKAITFPATIQQGVRHERIATGVIDTVLFGPIAGIVELDFVASPGPGQSPYQLNMYLTPTQLVPTLTPFDGEPAPCGLTNLTASVVRGHTLHPYIDHTTVRVPLVIGRTTVAICVVAVDRNHVPAGGQGTYPIALDQIPSGFHFSTTGEAFFANILSAKGTCPDLVIPLFDAAERPYSLIWRGKGTFNVDACSVDTTTSLVLAGKPFAEIDMASGAGPALITSAGIYTSFTPTAQPALLPTRPWTYAVVADLQGDGLQDFVTMGTASDVEVFRQIKPGLNLLQPIQFIDLDIPTIDPVADIALGNFDADNAGDVAIATIGDTGNGELSVAWGSVDTTFTLGDVGALPGFTAMAATNLLDVSLPPGLDHNDDLVIARGGQNTANPNDPALLVTEYGSTSRALTAPFVDYSSFGGMQPLHGAGVLAEIGNFGTSGSPGVFAMFQPGNAASSSVGTGPPDDVSILDLTYESFGSFKQSGEGLANVACATSLTTDTPFCPANAAYARVLLANGDLLLGLRQDVEAEPKSQCAGYFLAADATPALATISCADLAPAAATSTDPDVMAAYAALTGVGRIGSVGNIDGAQRLEVDVTKKHAEQAFLWQLAVDASGRPQLASPIAIDSEIDASGLLPPGGGALCTDVNEIELGSRRIDKISYGSGVHELVAACTISLPGTTTPTYAWGIFARYTDPGGGSPHYEQLLYADADPETRLRTADVNGDGLTDIIYTIGAFATGHQDVHVLLQCDTHQTGCVGGP